MRKISSKYLNFAGLKSLMDSNNENGQNIAEIMFLTSFGYVIGTPSNYEVPGDFDDAALQAALNSDTYMNAVSVTRQVLINKLESDQELTGDGAVIILKNVTITASLGTDNKFITDTFLLHSDSVIGMTLVEKGRF